MKTTIPLPVKVAATAFAIVLLTLAILYIHFDKQPHQEPLRILVPAYFYPAQTSTTTNPWHSIAQFNASVRTIVMNPSNGPGFIQDPAYSASVKITQAAGINVLGYVPTTYGSRDASLVQADVQAYAQWYDVDGIFLDEAAGDDAHLEYYGALSRFIRSVSGVSKRVLSVAVNPGVYPVEGYMAISDVVLAFEGSFAEYRDGNVTRIPPWAYTYPADRFLHVVHSTPENDSMKIALTLARERNVGRVFVTDAGEPNPYERLPSYFESEALAV